GQGFRYRLSPLFDVVTQEGTIKHMLHIGPGMDNAAPAANGRLGSLENALSGAAQWGLKPAAADKIIEQVQDVVSRRHQFYREAGMRDDEIGAVARWVKIAWDGDEEMEAPSTAHLGQKMR